MRPAAGTTENACRPAAVDDEMHNATPLPRGRRRMGTNILTIDSCCLRHLPPDNKSTVQ